MRRTVRTVSSSSCNSATIANFTDPHGTRSLRHCSAYVDVINVTESIEDVYDLTAEVLSTPNPSVANSLYESGWTSPSEQSNNRLERHEPTLDPRLMTIQSPRSERSNASTHARDEIPGDRDDRNFDYYSVRLPAKFPTYVDLNDDPRKCPVPLPINNSMHNRYLQDPTMAQLDREPYVTNVLHAPSYRPFGRRDVRVSESYGRTPSQCDKRVLEMNLHPECSTGISRRDNNQYSHPAETVPYHDPYMERPQNRSSLRTEDVLSAGCMDRQRPYNYDKSVPTDPVPEPVKRRRIQALKKTKFLEARPRSRRNGRSRTTRKRRPPTWFLQIDGACFSPLCNKYIKLGYRRQHLKHNSGPVVFTSAPLLRTEGKASWARMFRLLLQNLYDFYRLQNPDELLDMILASDCYVSFPAAPTWCKATKACLFKFCTEWPEYRIQKGKRIEIYDICWNQPNSVLVLAHKPIFDRFICAEGLKYISGDKSL